MPIYTLVALSLFIIPSIGAVVLDPLISITDASKVKEFLVLISILGVIILRRIAPPSNIPVRHNFSLYGLMAFLFLSAFHGPDFNLLYGNGDLAGSWVLEATFWAFMYFFFYLFVTEPSEKDKKLIILAIGGAAILSAGYAVLQALGLDQAQFSRPHEQIGNPKVAHITAVIGNPTYLGVFLAMSLPFVFFFKKRWVLLVSGAIVLTQSVFAISGLIFYALLWGNLGGKRYKKVWIGMSVALIILGLLGAIRGKIWNNGRFPIWKQTFNDARGPVVMFPITPGMDLPQRLKAEAINQKNFSWYGRGLGSFKYLSKTGWESAHNEPLEAFYSIGLFGVILGGMALWPVLKTRPKDKFYLACWASLLYACFASAGIPLLHVEPLRYLCAINFIFLSKK